MQLRAERRNWLLVCDQSSCISASTAEAGLCGGTFNGDESNGIRESQHKLSSSESLTLS
jgi:hypothetical protein